MVIKNLETISIVFLCNFMILSHGKKQVIVNNKEEEKFMYSKLEALDSSKHQELRFSKAQSFNFAKSISSIHISFSEMQYVSQYYPIIFPADGSSVPMALLSVKEGENKYVDANGKWKVPYIPICIRMYPFAMVRIQEVEDKYALCLDRDAEHFSSGQGDPLFTANGEKNEFVEGVLSSLTAYQKELINTQAIFAGLINKELIEERSINYEVNKETKGINGFNGFNMEKLLTMDDEFIAGLVKNGTMPLIYYHLNSLSKVPLLAS